MLTLVTPVLAIALTLVVGAIIFATLGYDPLQALYQFFVAPVSRLIRSPIYSSRPAH